MLVRLVDKVNEADAALNAQLTKRGDVISIQVDGFAWSDHERNSGTWTIVKVPGVPIDDLSAYLVPEPFNPMVDQHKLPQRRAFKFDIDRYQLLPAAAQAALIRAQALAFKITKPIVPNPNVLRP